MIKFFKNIALFLLISLIIGEVVVRVTHPTSDIPQRFIDNTGIQKYFPNQKGYWKGGNHEWKINKLGWPGKLPTAYDNLIVIIGDSFIFLKQNIKQNNYIEASRSGVSLIEAMEIAKQMDSLNPIQTLIYVTDIDFYESIKDIKTLTDITQVDLKNESIIFGKMKSQGLKKVLYNWKLLYYFYTRFPLNTKTEKIKNEKEVDRSKSKKNVFNLLNYIKGNYSIDDKILVFHPNSSQYIINQSKAVGFKTISLDSKDDEQWTFDYDPHWTCYGHKKAAEQVSDYLFKNLIKK
jgi:flagellar biosynthesis regulator FlbT